MAEIRIIVALPPGYASSAERHGFVPAHMAYSIGRGFRLFRLKNASGIKGGLMVLDISGFKGGGPVSALVSDIAEECRACGFSGIVIDAGKNRCLPVQTSLSKILARAAYRHDLDYFVPEQLASSGENAIVRVSTALSGGTLRSWLADAASKYGAERVAVEIERVRMDFALPARSGVGKELLPDSLPALRERYGGQVYFSPELCVKYFTYNDKGTAHFVLFDDAQSIRTKLSAAKSAGIANAFLFYPQVEDIFGDISALQGGKP